MGELLALAALMCGLGVVAALLASAEGSGLRAAGRRPQAAGRRPQTADKAKQFKVNGDGRLTQHSARGAHR